MRVTDKQTDVACRDEDRVHARTLELGHIVRARDGELRDHELPSRHVGEQLQEAIEVVLIVVRLLGRQEEDLGVDGVEHELEIVFVSHLQHAFDAERVDLIDELGEPLSRMVYIDDNCVCVTGLGGPPDPDEGQPGRAADAVGHDSYDEPLRPLAGGERRALGIPNLDEDGDAVTFGDRLAQPAEARHFGGCYSSRLALVASS